MAVTELRSYPTPARLRNLLTCLLVILCLPAQAAVLPEERVDNLYHSYDGGGVTIDGPSILVRKNIGETVSLSANYYVDMISGASIDVEATASAYSEERKEYSLGADYLVDKTRLSVGYTNSNEDDYQAETTSFSVSQDFFGDLSTLSMRVSFGNDDVGRNGDENFAAEATHRRYGLTWNQVLTPKLMAALSIETVSDEGFLNNPYRSVRYLDPTVEKGFSYEPELYPTTRNSDALALRAIYRLPYRAALKGEARTYADSWGISARNFELRYTHPLGESLLLEAKLRQYQQNGADFYSDLFDYSEATNFRARDKELSDYTTSTVGLGVTYRLPGDWSLLSDRNTINLYWDYMMFDYDNFSDVRVHERETNTLDAGEEPSYKFASNVIRLYWSLWF